MNTFIKLCAASLLCFIASSFAYADENSQSPCGNIQSTSVNGKNEFTLSELDQDIDKLRHELSTDTNRHSKRISTHHNLKKRLKTLNTARQHLIDDLYIGGCKNLENRASTKAKIERLEKTIAELKEKNS